VRGDAFAVGARRGIRFGQLVEGGRAHACGLATARRFG
jgi:hypothetical protein